MKNDEYERSVREDFDFSEITDDMFRIKKVSGGRASRGLNYLLGEDDQNVRMPSPGGVPGLLGE